MSVPAQDTPVLQRLAALIRHDEAGYPHDPNSVYFDDAEEILFELRDAARAEIAALAKAEGK